LKKLVLFICFVSALLAKEPQPTTELELLLFKVGFYSLLKDVKADSKETKSNSSEIALIKEKLKYLASKLQSDVMLKDRRVFSSNNQEITILKEIQKDLKSISKRVDKLEKNQKIVKTSLSHKSQKKSKSKKRVYKRKADGKVARVISNWASIRSKPTFESKIVKKFYRNDKFRVKSCNSYGWCKLSDGSGYIAKYLITGV
jgi:hypothetical protein